MIHVSDAPVSCANVSISVGTESFPVTDPTLRLIVLSQIASIAATIGQHQGSGRDGGDVGLSTLARIRALPFADLVRMANVSRSASIAISVDIDQLATDVNRYDLMQAATAMFEYFVRAEASISMMIDLFKTTAKAVKASQAALGVVTRIGRPSVPDECVRIDIIDEWHRLANTHPFARERYYALHQRFTQFTLAELDGVINAGAPRNNPRR